MRCRYVNKIFLSEENGFTVAVYSTSDESVPLSARNKYLESRNIIGFTAVGYNLPLTNTIELEMEGDWENGSHGLQLKVDSFMEIVPRTKAGIPSENSALYKLRRLRCRSNRRMTSLQYNSGSVPDCSTDMRLPAVRTE